MWTQIELQVQGDIDISHWCCWVHVWVLFSTSYPWASLLAALHLFKHLLDTLPTIHSICSILIMGKLIIICFKTSEVKLLKLRLYYLNFFYSFLSFSSGGSIKSSLPTSGAIFHCFVLILINSAIVPFEIKY